MSNDNLFKILELAKVGVTSVDDATNMIKALMVHDKKNMNEILNGDDPTTSTGDIEVIVETGVGKIVLPVINNNASLTAEKLESNSLGNVQSDISVVCGNIDSECLAGHSVKAKNIGDMVHVGASVKCKNVGGSVRAGASVKAKRVYGNVHVAASVVAHGNVAGDVRSGCYVKCDAIGGNVHSNTVVEIRREDGTSYNEANNIDMPVL